jgi:hypothetical protein
MAVSGSSLWWELSRRPHRGLTRVRDGVPFRASTEPKRIRRQIGGPSIHAAEAECLVLQQLCAAQKSPSTFDGRIFAGYAAMRAGPRAARSLFVAGTILVASHVTLLVFYPVALFPSNLLVLMYPLLAVTVCLLGAYSESSETRPSWLFFGSGLLVAAVGQLGVTYYDLATHIHTQTQAINTDFFFFAYAISLMLAICSRSTAAGLRTFAWLDGAQALIAAMLAYLQLSRYCPRMLVPRRSPRPISCI